MKSIRKGIHPLLQFLKRKKAAIIAGLPLVFTFPLIHLSGQNRLIAILSQSNKRE